MTSVHNDHRVVRFRTPVLRYCSGAGSPGEPDPPVRSGTRHEDAVGACAVLRFYGRVAKGHQPCHALISTT